MFPQNNDYREAIKEDKDGLVAGLVAEFAQKAARKAATPRRGPIRLGMMRHLIVAIDCSEAMSLQDLKPTRFLCTIKVSPNCTYLVLINNYRILHGI